MQVLVPNVTVKLGNDWCSYVCIYILTGGDLMLLYSVCKLWCGFMHY